MLTASFRNVPVAALAEEIATIANVDVVTPETLGSQQVSANLTAVPLDDALRRIFSGFDSFYFYDARASPSRLRTVWLYPKGTASALRPVGPEKWAGSNDLSMLIRDSDPAVRWTAYEALLDRPDAHSRRIITDALRGAVETDASVRERLLSNALSRQFDLPAELVGDLARADPSDQIRLIALDAIAQFSNGKQVAESALTDSNEAVRARAKEILADLASRSERRRTLAHEQAPTTPE